MTIFLIVAALIPAAGLLFYIYMMDRFEKEPFGLLVALFFLGVGSVIPAVILELIFGAGLSALFTGDVSGEVAPSSGIYYYIYQFFNNFICIALIEEACKWFFMFIITRKSRHFSCMFDGVVYAVFVSLGFAAAENVLYVVENGWGNAIMRAITAVPAHCFFAVFMGYYYTRWHTGRKAKALEKELMDNGVIPRGASAFNTALLLLLSILVPTAAHGFYDFCATVDSWIFTIIFFIFLGFMYFICFRNVYKLSRADNYSSYLSMDMVLKKHPTAAKYVSTMPEYAVYFVPPQYRRPPVRVPFVRRPANVQQSNFRQSGQQYPPRQYGRQYPPQQGTPRYPQQNRQQYPQRQYYLPRIIPTAAYPPYRPTTNRRIPNPPRQQVNPQSTPPQYRPPSQVQPPQYNPYQNRQQSGGQNFQVPPNQQHGQYNPWQNNQ